MAVSAFGFGQPEPLILDKIPGAVAALSLRKLKGSYNGAAVRIRRSSDNAEQDIGFAGKDFNWAAFAAFVGGGTGYVVTMYDQSGNGKNFTQSSAADQWKIVQNSALTTKPHFNTPGGGYVTSGLTIDNWNLTVSIVMRNTTNDRSSLVNASNNPPLSYAYFSFVADNQFYYWGSGGPNTALQILGGYSTTNNNNVLVAWANNGLKRIYVKGSLNNSVGTSQRTTFNPQLGYGYGSFLGFAAEIIMWSAGVSASNVTLLQSNQMSYYGIS